MSIRERFPHPYKKMFRSPLQLMWDLTVMYQSQTRDDVPIRRLPKGFGTRQCANKNTDPKEVNWGVPQRLEKGTSVSEDAGS